MDASMTIAEFNALLRAENKDVVLDTLRQLTRVEQPEEVRVLQDDVPQTGWQGWG